MAQGHHELPGYLQGSCRKGNRGAEDEERALYGTAHGDGGQTEEHDRHGILKRTRHREALGHLCVRQHLALFLLHNPSLC